MSSNEPSDNFPRLVTFDPKIVTAKVLRPWLGFETLYQGEDARVPVSFYEISVNPTDAIQVRDLCAGQPGYDANLERFVPVPMGSRVTVWIPYCTIFLNQEETIETVYEYTFHWRIRNLEKYVREQAIGAEAQGFHSHRRAGFDEAGRPPVARWAIPCATNTIIIEQSETAGLLQQSSHVKRERLRVMSTSADTAYSSILPDGTDAVKQQGVFDNSTAASNEVGDNALYLKVDFDAAGDELLIQANRFDAFADPPGAAWDFAALDAPFSNIYGVNAGGVAHVQPPGSGIYLLYGNAP